MLWIFCHSHTNPDLISEWNMLSDVSKCQVSFQSTPVSDEAGRQEHEQKDQSPHCLRLSLRGGGIISLQGVSAAQAWTERWLPGPPTCGTADMIPSPRPQGLAAKNDTVTATMRPVYPRVCPTHFQNHVPPTLGMRALASCAEPPGGARRRARRSRARHAVGRAELGGRKSLATKPRDRGTRG